MDFTELLCVGVAAYSGYKESTDTSSDMLRCEGEVFFFSRPHSPGNPQFDPVHSSSAGVPEGPAFLSFFRLLPWKPLEEEPIMGYPYLTFV